MKYVFLDLGARWFEVRKIAFNYLTDGNSKIDMKTKKPFFDQPFNMGDLEFHLFECLPDHFEQLEIRVQEIRDRFNANITIHKKAIYNKNGTANFYKAIDRWGTVGSTLMKEKREKLDLANPYTVETVDITEFIEDNFSKDDYIIMKIDTEGGEYDMLEHMLKTNSIDYITELHVEWHNHFFPGKGVVQRKLLDEFKKRNVNYKQWFY